jgi:F-type H+-transporting ATPase subunit delta
MKISKQARREAKDLFRTCQVNGLLDEARVREALAAVVARKPRGYVGILSHFQRLVRLEVERRSGRVESAVALASDQRRGLEANLTRLYGPGLAVAFAEKPALIGGIRVRVGCDVYDSSIQGRLEALKESF